MKPITFRMRNKQRLMALMIAGTVVGLGYQADIAQADTTAVESGDSTDQSSTTSTATAKTVTLSQQSPTTTENDAAETNSSTSEKTPAAATTPIAKPIAKPAAVTPQVRAISTPTATAPQSTNSSAVTPTTTASIVKTGTFGTAPWTLDSDGNMVISAGTFRGGELGSYNHTDVKHVTFAGKVVLGTDASRLFSGWSSLTGIDGLANLDTSQTVLMDDMFSQTGLQ